MHNFKGLPFFKIQTYPYPLAGSGALAEGVGLATGMLQGTGQVHASLELAWQQGRGMKKWCHTGGRGVWKRGEGFYF